jgi:hypothetical protein
MMARRLVELPERRGREENKNRKLKLLSQASAMYECYSDGRARSVTSPLRYFSCDEQSSNSIHVEAIWEPTRNNHADCHCRESDSVQKGDRSEQQNRAVFRRDIKVHEHCEGCGIFKTPRSPPFSLRLKAVLHWRLAIYMAYRHEVSHCHWSSVVCASAPNIWRFQIKIVTASDVQWSFALPTPS